VIRLFDLLPKNQKIGQMTKVSNMPAVMMNDSTLILGLMQLATCEKVMISLACALPSVPIDSLPFSEDNLMSKPCATLWPMTRDELGCFEAQLSHSTTIVLLRKMRCLYVEKRLEDKTKGGGKAGTSAAVNALLLALNRAGRLEEMLLLVRDVKNDMLRNNTPGDKRWKEELNILSFNLVADAISRSDFANVERNLSMVLRLQDLMNRLVDCGYKSCKPDKQFQLIALRVCLAAQTPNGLCTAEMSLAQLSCVWSRAKTAKIGKKNSLPSLGSANDTGFQMHASFSSNDVCHILQWIAGDFKIPSKIFLRSELDMSIVSCGKFLDEPKLWRILDDTLPDSLAHSRASESGEKAKVPSISPETISLLIGAFGRFATRICLGGLFYLRLLDFDLFRCL